MKTGVPGEKPLDTPASRTWLVSHIMFDKINTVKNSGENFYWFSCSKLFTFDILFCAIYIPPEGSRYSDIDIFDTLESDLLELNPENKFEVCLLGDFISHTNNNSDFILIDENIEQTLHIENPDDRLGRITI